MVSHGSVTFQRWSSKFLMPCSMAYQEILTSGHTEDPSFSGLQLKRVFCSEGKEARELAIGPCAVKTGQNVTFGTHYCCPLMTVSLWHTVMRTHTQKCPSSLVSYFLKYFNFDGSVCWVVDTFISVLEEAQCLYSECDQRGLEKCSGRVGGVVYAKCLGFVITSQYIIFPICFEYSCL